MSNIPIIILNKDRLTYTRNLCKQLTDLGYDNINIYDSGSIYQPLLDWYKECSYDVYLANNAGHKAIWSNGFLKKFDMWPWIAVTDSDIRLVDNTPNNFIEQMIDIALTKGKDFRIDKVGLAIEYKKVKNYYLKNIITPIEEQYWKNKASHPVHELYIAPVDTTFCIVRSERPFTYTALRIADWPITHLPWNEDWDNLTEEQEFYHTHADPIIATGTKFYNDWKASH